MSHLLLVNRQSDRADKTLVKWLLARGHSLAIASEPLEALKQLGQQPCIDLVILDLNLGEKDGFECLQLIRTDLIFRQLPVLIYTSITRQETVTRTLNCGIQNYLIKPTSPKLIDKEIDKAEAAQWRYRFFKQFYELQDQYGYSFSDYKTYFFEVKQQLADLKQQPLQWAVREQQQTLLKHIHELKKTSKTIDCQILYSLATALKHLVLNDQYTELPECIQKIETVELILEEHLNLITIHNPDRSDASTDDEPTEEAILEKLESLQNLPTFENFAFDLQSATESNEFDIDQLSEIVRQDPGIAFELLSFANSAFTSQQREIDDIEIALQLLGVQRLQFIALSLTATHSPRHIFRAPDAHAFWAQQLECAMTCQAIIEELQVTLPQAYLAGLLHGIGKILLFLHYPEHYKKAVDYAHNYKLPLTEAEKEFFGISHNTIGEKYARIHNIPSCLVTAIGHQYSPETAEQHQELAAVLNIALFLCNKYGLRTSGTVPLPAAFNSLHKLPAWKIIKDWANPPFAVENFEARMERTLRSIKAGFEISLV